MTTIKKKKTSASSSVFKHPLHSSMPVGVKIPSVGFMSHPEDCCLGEVKTIIGHMICGYL